MRFVAFSVLVLFSFSSCAFVAPVVESVKSMGISEGDRQGELSKSVKAFNTAMYWRASGNALSFVKDDGVRDDLKSIMRARRNKERLVETEVGLVDYNENSTQAEVEVFVKFYRIPQYIVIERIEVQDWEFSFTQGWRLAGLKELEQEDAA